MCIKFETEEISITGLAARVIRKRKIEEKVRSFALRVSLFQAPRGGGGSSVSLPFSFFPPHQLFTRFLLSLLLHYLRAWNTFV